MTSTKASTCDAPLGETATDWIGLGFAEDLDDALVACLRELIAWLHAASGVSEGEAYALCSMAASFRVTQYAHQTGSAYTSTPPKTVHPTPRPRRRRSTVSCPKSIFPANLQAQIGGWLRPDAGTSVMNTADRLDILDLIARADTAATARETADTYISLFTAGAVLDGPTGEVARHRGAAPSRRPHLGLRGSDERPPHPQRRHRFQPDEAIGSRRGQIEPAHRGRAESPPAIRAFPTSSKHVVKANGSWRIERRSVYPID